ncbi:hypothetical protein [Clostridium tarantellae]|uniref:DUF11 domain-containing protein n=1 Tax=Clostridium tarantellae TaxID=39493 RepID=A0A6I1MNE3_9CLOT|nr:hypothetical protein [Clostridium tarantellae]MPQ45016.1 hypothetical protein [Clostridium tarantellae]
MNEVSMPLYSFAPKNLPYVEITNMGGFVASFFVTYTLNGKEEFKESGVFSIFFSKKIEIPFGATNIHVLVNAYNGLAQWNPIYNNNFNTPSTLKLTLHGTIWNPHYKVIKDPNPINYYVEAANNSGIIALLLVQYNFEGKRYSIITDEFSLGMIRTVNLPKDATNIYIALKPSSGKLRIAYPNFYEKNLSKPINLELKFYGSLYAETVWENGKEVTEDIDNIIKLIKFPDKGDVYVGQPIEFSIVLTNHSKNNITDIMLWEEFIPDSAKFVENSLKVNSESIYSTSFPKSGIFLGNLNATSTSTIRYKVIFNSIPLITKLDGTLNHIDYTFAEQPKITYSYIDSNNNKKTVTLIGNIEPITIRNPLNTSPYNSLNLNIDYSDEVKTPAPLNSSNTFKRTLNDNTIFNSYEQYINFFKSIQ